MIQGMGYDRRIGLDFVEPGPGWGGSCLPKDTRALIRISEDAGYDFSLLRCAITSNEEQQDRIVAKIEAMVGGALTDITVAAWGLTFKAGTDDRRHSPAIAIIHRLARCRGEGARLRPYRASAPARNGGVPGAVRTLPGCVRPRCADRVGRTAPG